MRNKPNVIMSGEIIDVDVGVVTGNNDYFVMSKEEVRKRNLKNHCIPIVTRSAHLDGLIYNDKDWKISGMYLFAPPDIEFGGLPAAVKEFILEGQKNGFNSTYKCRIRKKWYMVPSLRNSEGFMLRQVHSYPKLILNKTGATCTDTIHRVRFLTKHKPEIISAAFLNSMTLAFSEITGRSYGGGVMTFEPSEAEMLPMCLLNAEKIDTKRIDRLLRLNQIDKILDINDELLLKDGLGSSAYEISSLRSIWLKLRDRRINRKHAYEQERPAVRKILEPVIGPNSLAFAWELASLGAAKAHKRSVAEPNGCRPQL